ncbi:MAG: restriction endonuclease subunit S [Nitrosomonas sp.]|nr:restriction endonuclease subunit S [Nitrosomonas sp.]MDP1952058.1 restriction endonuclease subunit S [Nitrosomonas sp.]
MSNKAHKRGLLPKLRFPEFREAGEWKEKRLEDFAVIVRGGSPRPIDEYITNAPSGLNWLKIGDIDKESKYVTSTQDKVIPAALNKTRVVSPGDLILSNSMSFGRPYILEIKTCIHDGWIAVSEIDKSLDRDYLYYLMMTSASQTYFSNNAAGSGVQNLNADIIKLLPVSYPSKKEQQKIADCLSSLDEVITLEAQKLDTLKTHKKGLMQQLFPAEGETLPKLRFPEFRDAGEWEVKSVGDFGDVVTGSTPSTVRPEFYGGGIPFVSPADISDLRFVNGTKTTLTALGFDEIRPIKANSVLFVCIGSTIGKVTQNERVCATNQQLNSVIPNAEHSGGFVYYILSLSAGRIANLAGKQAVPIINKTQFSAVRLPVPELREQERIADCLASLDDLIAAQTQQLTALKTHKKGLMQQLFPAED